MRERTPSADDTPKRAPPAPPREAASTDVAGSKTSSEALDVSHTSTFASATTSASSTATTRSSPSCVDARMVASTHNLDDLGVGGANDRQQQQEKHGYAYKSAQTAQDKRSRLSNVINNLRKKVPDSRNGDSPRKEEDDRNSVERNLETLEKYVMTVLNGVIKDEEDDNREKGRKKETGNDNETEKMAADQEDEDSKGPAAKFEPSKPNESRTETAVFPSETAEKSESKDSSFSPGNSLGSADFDCSGVKDSPGCRSEAVDEDQRTSDDESEEETRDLEDQVQERTDGQENRTLGAIIMERLSENQSDDRQDCREFVTDNAELRNVCRDLLNDLLNGINQLIDGNSQQKEESRTIETPVDTKESRSQEFSTTSLHCSLPLDKVASVLQHCQTNDLTAPQSPTSPSSTSQSSKSPCKPSSPTVRHCLCLYCDRKFMSISLRQRHTERVHQQGGRRPERNSRKSSQNCQYCSDKCAEGLDGLFQHMVGSHGDKYYGCLQCCTRYLTKEALAGHMAENHGTPAERNVQIQEKAKEVSPCKEPGSQSPRQEAHSPKERRLEDSDYEQRAESILLKPMLPIKDNFSNPGSPEFDSSFYSSVSCNIRENLLHHLDGKLQSSSAVATSAGSSLIDTKPPQTFYEHNANQIQLPIDISLTAATPVYSKEYSSKEYENNSEYAQKPGKSNRSHPRRVSFEKYNFPRKYDGKEQWTCSIKDLSYFDISTQLSLSKKQQLLKERLSLNRLRQIPVLGPSETTEIAQEEQSVATRSPEEPAGTEDAPAGKNDKDTEPMTRRDVVKTVENKSETSEVKADQGTEFSVEFGNFLRLRRWDEKTSVEAAKKQEIVYAELTGEWSRPRVYICGACASKHVTLKDMEDHKVTAHPNVWCSHFEFSGDQRELYKHLFLPGRDVPTAKARTAILAENVCTKCSKNCNTLPELHRHMLECGGDQAWLLGLFGNGKKKCKWRPFGSRSRRRRQRGMKRNIQNSQTPRVNTPKEKQPTGPRVRPSDRESIQKMLANLPPKRATRKVLQDNSLRTQGRLRNVQSRTRQRMVGESSSASRMSRNKAALRNKLLKNAKSIQRNRCRIDNISAVIESVVNNYAPEDRRSAAERREDAEDANFGRETKERSTEGSAKSRATLDDRGNRAKLIRGPRVLGKKRNVKTKEASIKTLDQTRKIGTLKAKARTAARNPAENKTEPPEEAARTMKSLKTSAKVVDKDTEDSDGPENVPRDTKSPSLSMKNKSLVLTTPKRKRPVDPVASLNASIKAKSQLRTQDGKFARNPNKESLSPQKSSPEAKSPVSDRAVTKARATGASPELSSTRSKFRAISRGKPGEQLPKRMTRLSSDSDKMPTLEPAVQLSSAVEEFPETAPNDLPILSPATPAVSPEKVLRGKGFVGKNLNLNLKESTRKAENDSDEGNGDSARNARDEDRDQKQGKGRRVRKSSEDGNPSGDGCRAATKASRKEKIKRRSEPGRILALEKRGAGKSEDPKEEWKQRKDDGKLETRSNSRSKWDNVLDDEDLIRIENVPFEVKKLIGSDCSEDLLTKLVLTSRVAASKRRLRQSVTKKPDQVVGRGKRYLDLERKLDSGSTSDASTKKEKFDARRKSLRNTDKKERLTSRKDRTLLEDGNEARAAVGGKRSSSLSSESRLLSSDGQSKTEVEACDNKRLTRGSLVNSEELQSEVGDLKKTTVGRRRGRVKGAVHTSESVEGKNSMELRESQGQTAGVNITRNRRTDIDKDQFNTADPGQSDRTGRGSGSTGDLPVEQVNSVDSGKENSLEVPAPVQKLKVGRPRKSWAAKNERTAKRGFSSVIGVLTEGINVPGENQSSAVAVQASVQGPSAGDSVQDNVQALQTGNLESESTQEDNKSVQNILEGTSNSDALIEEAGPAQKISEGNLKDTESPEVSVVDQDVQDVLTEDPKSRNAPKEQAPANDIILDLSRRKQKGKGSFLEKIVSKIAKQKDALLEGEVGSLLDTAADELTSILDEVGPTLPDGSDGLSKARKKKDRDSKLDGEKESTNENSSFNHPGKNFETKDSKMEAAEGKATPTGEGPVIENDKGKKTEVPTIRCKEEINNPRLNIKTADESEKSKEIRSEVSADKSKVQVEVSATEVSSVSNLIEVLESIPAFGTGESKEESVEKDDSARTKTRSKRRSLEGNPAAKKNQRRLVEPVDDSLENQGSPGPRLDDVASLNEKSKQVPSTTETTENDSSTSEDRKRKSLTEEIESKNSLGNEAPHGVGTVESFGENVKKFKGDSQHGQRNEKERVGAKKSNAEHSVQSESAAESRSTMRIAGKRKSYVDELDQRPQAESPVRRSSKRRSLQEEKSNPSFEEETSATVEITERRRSSRTKYLAQAKTGEKEQEEPEREEVESLPKDSSKNDKTWMQEDLDAGTLSGTAEDSGIVEKGSKLKNVKDQVENVEDTVQNIVVNDSKGPEKVALVVPKVPKKRGRKKKCLIIDHMQPQIILPHVSLDFKGNRQSLGLEIVSKQFPPRRSLRTSRLNEESEDHGKHSADLVNPPAATSTLEHFKVPEVTEVFQHTKKRTYKKRSTMEEQPDTYNRSPLIEPEINSTEQSELTKNLLKKEEQTENSQQKESSESRKCLAKDSPKEQLKSFSSSGSVDLSETNRTRSAKRKQLSSEDLSGQESQNQRAESADNLSETSCASESSYFRKKRFSKKKKELQPPEEVQTDTSVTDSESVDAEKGAGRRQSLKRRAKKNISFLEDLLFLVDGFDIPMDIQDCITREDTVEHNVGTEPPTVEDKVVTDTASTEVPEPVPQGEASKDEEAIVEESKKSVEEEEDEEAEVEEINLEKEEEKMDEKVDSLSQAQDDFQTPRKRAAGNYVVVHKKTGEVLIVEKRKKLTKEAARFFCDVCTTSFTRKSSLKKHNQSQSHLVQMVKCKRSKTTLEDSESMDDSCNLNENDGADVSSDENGDDEVMNASMESTHDQEELGPGETISKNNLESPGEDSCYAAMMEQNSIMDSERNEDNTLEDELLDEEICKITENMSHDEYVLTDHVSPEPDSASTPIKSVEKREEQPEEGKGKKKVLENHEATESNSPGLVISEEPASTAILATNGSSKIAKSSDINLSVNNFKSTDVLEEIVEIDSSFTGSLLDSRNNSVNRRENEVQNGCANEVPSLHENKYDLDLETVQEKTEAVSKNCLSNAGDRLSPEFVINERSMEPAEQIAPESNRNFNENHSNALHKDVGLLDEDSGLTDILKSGNVTGLEADETLNVSKLQAIADDSVKTTDSPRDQLTVKTMVDGKSENEKPCDSVKPSRHGKSKRGKSRKHLEEVESSSGDKANKKLSKSKDTEDRVFSDEVTTISENMAQRKSVELTGTYNSNENLRYLDGDYYSINRAGSPQKLGDEIESNGFEIVKEQNAFAGYSDACDLGQVSQKYSESRSRKIKAFSPVEDEDSSSSSLADKPLSQVLLERAERLGQMKGRESSKSLLKDSKEKATTEERGKVEETKQRENVELDTYDSPMAQNDLIDNRTSDELFNNEESELLIASEDDCIPEKLRATGDSDKDSKSLSESESSEAAPSMKKITNDKESYEAKVSGNDGESSTGQQGLNKKSTRTHRYSNKGNYRRSRAKRASIRNKMADLSSESDDSEDEDKIKSQNKSKIVKSVFGRVFGGEKTDKVKEVLNDWVSKSEDDSEVSRTDLRSSSPNGLEIMEEATEDTSAKRHSLSQSLSPNHKKRSGRKSKKSSSPDGAKEKNPIQEEQEEYLSRKQAKSKSSSNNRRKYEAEASNNSYFQNLPSSKCRPSKKRAEELISRTFENDIFETVEDKNQKSVKHRDANDVSRSKDKLDLMIKDSGYGSFNYDEDSSKVLPSEDPIEDEQKIVKRRKSSASRKSRCKTDDEDWSDLILDKKPLKNSKESGDEEANTTKDHAPEVPIISTVSVDVESSQSCSSLAPSSVRNRSPSMDRNSQTTRDSDAEEEEDDGIRHRISPLFVCVTPRSSIGSSSHSENEEEDENLIKNEAVTRKRSSSEFSGEKIVNRSPSSTRKGEVVTITPTDAIEDNALDVPQGIEPTKPRQGKVLNFDEELFVECCSRLKATTENELRGAKKIKLDHSDGYHRKDEQVQGLRGPRDRWRDVESQNSLGSLLESVNQLLGEEMYSTRERDYPKRGSRNLRSEHSSRSISPDISRPDNLGYEDSLDVAFEHNNKLRDKIQQRMRESENLIASTFGQNATNEMLDGRHISKRREPDISRNSCPYLNDHRQLPATNLFNGGYTDALHMRNIQEQQTGGKIHLDSIGLKSKMNSSLGGLLDKALSNLLHNNEKHDHNGSTPMNVLAELACARAPTSTAGDSTSHEAIQLPKTSSLNKDSLPDPSCATSPKDPQKKPRNPIRELFERKKELNERKHLEKSKAEAALRELNVHRQRKTKKAKKHQDFPLIRRNELGGLVERKKRRDGFDRKEEFSSNRIKDVYEFDEEESQMEPNLGSVMSYRCRPGYEVSCLRTKDVDVPGLMSKAIGDTLENGKAGDALSTTLESMIDRKFKELEKFAPKTKGALKAFQGEDQQRQVTGPMDEFVERKQPKSKKTVEPSLKHSRLKKRSKNSKKKTRNAWYENDSSDEYRTAIKTDDVGVGISKSQRTCSKGKQNIFAELYTSSESEYDEEGVDYESRRQRRAKKTTRQAAELDSVDQSRELMNKYSSGNEEHMDDWRNEDLKSDAAKRDCDNKKSESEMSDQPLVIDERKDLDEQRNSDDETENQYERNFEMDDLYREDSSVLDSDAEGTVNVERSKVQAESEARDSGLPAEKIDEKADYMQEDELIPLEEALNLLDQDEAETHSGTSYSNSNSKPVEQIDNLMPMEPEKPEEETFEEPVVTKPTPAEEQEEEAENDVLSLPEKLSSNTKPQKESENLPLHVFLSRKVQESKKRKEQQLRKIQEEQERILMDLQPTRRPRKCAIGKQGLLAEISSSDEELSPRERRFSDKSDHERARKQKRESKEKKKERYIEKKHEQIIAKEQKAIEEEILREIGKKKESCVQNSIDENAESNEVASDDADTANKRAVQDLVQKKKHQAKEKLKKQGKSDEELDVKNNQKEQSDLENNSTKSTAEENEECSVKQKKHSKSPVKSKKSPRTETRVANGNRKSRNANADRRSKTDAKGTREKERRSSSGKRDSDDEELKTTKSWNKVEEGVGVAIGRRKRAAANQLYYWSSSSDEEELLEVAPTVEEEAGDRQEQHGWIVGDSHKKMITMLAMEKQLKEKRRRSEDEFEPGKAKSKKHRNSTS